MLADRDYMREPTRAEPMRVTTGLILLTGIAFFCQILFDFDRNQHLRDIFYLSKAGILQGKVWQLLTFQVMHSGLLHILFNMLGLYFFGRPVEERMERKQFLKLYFISGVIGGLVQLMAGAVFPKFGGPIVGASAGVTAVMAAFSLMFWHERFRVLLFFILPLELTGQFFFWLILASSVIGIGLGAISSAGPGIAHFAHLGGFFAAFLFVPGAARRFRMPDWMPSRENRRRPEEFVNVGGEAGSRMWSKRRPPVEEEVPSEEFISKEVDPILDKISAHGIQSLTERERKILEKARSKMAKR